MFCKASGAALLCTGTEEEDKADSMKWFPCRCVIGTCCVGINSSPGLFNHDISVFNLNPLWSTTCGSNRVGGGGSVWV